MTANRNQLIFERIERMERRGLGSSTVNSRLQCGQETKSPTASTSSLDLHLGHRIFTPGDSNLVQLDASGFLTPPQCPLDGPNPSFPWTYTFKRNPLE